MLNPLAPLKFILHHPLNEKRRIHALGCYLKWQIGSRLVPGKILYKWLDDACFIVASGDTGLTGNIYCGLHEFEEMSFILHTLTDKDVFVDIGANLGSYTIIACKMKGAKGYCFEPAPSNYERLVLNLLVNRLNERVISCNIGIGDQEEKIRFSSHLDTMNHALTQEETRLPSIEIDVLPLDDTIPKNENPTMLKIDVEGFESKVIKGASRILRQPQLHSIIIELVGMGNRYGFDERLIFDQLLSYGFAAHHYKPFERKLIKLPNEWREPGTIIFVRNYNLVKNRINNSPPILIHGYSY